MNDVAIEQMGGFVGPGGPASHIHMRGRVAWSALSEADRAALDRLFAGRQSVNANLYYRLTRSGEKGSETIDALPDDVPAALRDSVKTELD